MKAKAHYSCS